MESQRQRAAAARPERVVTPEAKARWNRAYKFSRLGISEERFNAVLEAQGRGWVRTSILSPYAGWMAGGPAPRLTPGPSSAARAAGQACPFRG